MTKSVSETNEKCDFRVPLKRPMQAPSDLFRAFQSACEEAYLSEIGHTLHAHREASRVVDLRLPCIEAPKWAKLVIQPDGYKKRVEMDELEYAKAMEVCKNRHKERANAWNELLPTDSLSLSDSILNYFSLLQSASFFTKGEPLILLTEESIHKFIVDRIYECSGWDVTSYLSDIDFQPFLLKNIAFHGQPFYKEDDSDSAHDYEPDSDFPRSSYQPHVKDDSVDDENPNE